MTTLSPEVKAPAYALLPVTDFAHNALRQARAYTHATTTATIRMALRLETEVTRAVSQGGAFAIRPHNCHKLESYFYSRSERPLADIRLDASSLEALRACMPSHLTGVDELSKVLDRALRRWRDVVAAQMAGGCACIKSSARSQFTAVVYSTR